MIITLEIPDEIKERIFAGFAKRYYWDPRNGTQEEFLSAKLLDLIYGAVKNSEMEVAAETARTTAAESFATEVESLKVAPR